MSVAIGIDLGTTNTVVAAVVDGVAVTLEDDHGRRLLPSVVSFHPSSTVLVGEPARERRLIDPQNTIYSVKPLLGRSWDSDEVKAAAGRFPFQLVQGTKNSTMVLARDVAYALPEISAFVLRRAKAIAEAALGETVERAVITVPANFNDLQRASTKIAGKLAGLEVMRILNEPTAAALAYGQSISKAEKIGVYDLGGGTFDITLLDLTGSVFEVLGTAGDTALGGDDIDRLLVERIAMDVLRRFNIDPRTDPALLARLAFTAEEIKKELSAVQQVQREISGLGNTPERPLSMPFSISRQELEALTRPLLARTIAVAKQSIASIDLAPRDFDRVILVGGSTRMPLVARMVEELFGQPPHLKVNPDEVVALGAAIQAHALNRTKSAPKRRSGHDHLADAQPKPQGGRMSTQPPHADPTLGQEDVPKAPPVPSRVGAAPPTTPEFISFNKAPARISFSAVPPPLEAAKPAAPAPPAAAKPPAVPKKPPALPNQRPRLDTAPLGATPPSASRLEAHRPPSPSAPELGGVPRPSARGSVKPIEGRTIRDPSEAIPSGPKPARSIVPAPAIPDLPSIDRHGNSIVAASPAFDLDDIELPSGPPVAPPLPTREPSIAGARPSGGVLAGPEELFSGIELDRGPSHDRALSFTDQRFKQGSAINTARSTPLLIDVTPLSLGVETAGGYADVLIPANSPVPCEKSRVFLTANDGQSMVSIRVAQGESSRFAANTRLGDLELSNLRAARRGEVKIQVTFELDADGILNVRARDQETGRETMATMRLLGASTDAEDVGAMVERQARHVVA